jgi:hypothetical protein
MNNLTTNRESVTDWKLNAEIRALKWECERQLRQTEWKLSSQIRELEWRVQRESLSRSTWVDWAPLWLPSLLFWLIIIVGSVCEHAAR